MATPMPGLRDALEAAMTGGGPAPDAAPDPAQDDAAVCPVCGASVKKIEAASAGPAAPSGPPEMGM